MGITELAGIKPASLCCSGLWDMCRIDVLCVRQQQFQATTCERAALLRKQKSLNLITHLSRSFFKSSRVKTHADLTHQKQP